MNNRILSITRNTIPYVKELQPICGHSIAACILMQQLDYWFDRYPEGFYKFMEPSDHQLCKEGQSWCEELGMTAEEFRTAFDKIGFRHRSKTQFEESADKFQKKFYCSYLDRRSNATYYFRNDKALDKALDKLISSENKQKRNDEDASFTVNQESPVTVNRESPVTVNQESRFREIGNPDLLNISTEPTTDKQQQPTPEPKLDLFSNIESCCCKNLIFPKLHFSEKTQIENLLKTVPEKNQQEILDELAGAIKTNSIKKGAIPFCRSLVTAVSKNTFTPSLGISILAIRERENQLQTAENARKTLVLAPPPLFKKPSEIPSGSALAKSLAKINDARNAQKEAKIA